MRTLLSHETGAAIRAYIVDKQLKPGDPLPPEAELAALLDLMLDHLYLEMPRSEPADVPWREKVRAVAEAGQRRGEDLVAARPQVARDGAPRPAA